MEITVLPNKSLSPVDFGETLADLYAHYVSGSIVLNSMHVKTHPVSSRPFILLQRSLNLPGTGLIQVEDLESRFEEDYLEVEEDEE